MSNYTLSISEDEALVLFEFFARFDDSGKLQFEHAAEYLALLRVCNRPLHPPRQLSTRDDRSQGQLSARADRHSRGVSVAGSPPSARPCSTSFKYAHGSTPSKPQVPIKE